MSVLEVFKQLQTDLFLSILQLDRPQECQHDLLNRVLI